MPEPRLSSAYVLVFLFVLNDLR